LGALEAATVSLTRRNALPKILRKADMPTQNLTAEIIAAALDGYEFQKTRIAASPEPTEPKRPQ
jgi:DTW domain-containing protein YfiP